MDTVRPERTRSRRLTVTEVALSRLRPAPYNPRVMSPAELSKLGRSIQEFGFVEPLVVRRADDSIIGGHQRLEAAKTLGLASIPVVYVDVSEAEAKALNLALNRIQGDWDLPKLGELLEELAGLPEVDVNLTGFDGDEIDQLLADLERQAAPSPRETSFPAAMEALQAWRDSAPRRVQCGDLWQLGRHRLLCADMLIEANLTRLCAGPVDAIITDPPYGIDYRSELPTAGRRKAKIANDGAAGFEAFLARALPLLKGQLKRGGVIYWFAAGGGPSAMLGTVLLAFETHFTLLNTLVWDKVDPGLGWRWRRSWEASVEASLGRPKRWYGGTEQRNVLRFPRAIPQVDDHPTPKPVPLLEELIRAATPARGGILDPFAGSGSTLIAAEQTGRRALVGELEPRYGDLVLARWEALTGEGAKRL